MDKPATDFRGTILAPGQTVVYPGRRGSSLWMNEGVIKEVSLGKSWSGEEYWYIKVERDGSERWVWNSVTKEGHFEPPVKVTVKIVELNRVVVVP